MEVGRLENEDWEKMRRIHLTDMAVCGMMILKSTSKKEAVKVWTKFSWLRIRSVGETCELCSDPSGYIWKKFPEKLSHG
jgi:hypothetical protein